MADARTSIRLGVEGGPEITRTLDTIAESGDASAKRLARAYERASEDATAAIQRQANAAAKISAIMPQSAVQMRVDANAGTGFGQWEGSARSSAAAFAALIAEEERWEARTRALIGVIEPGVAAQERYNASIREAQALYDAGRISIDQYAAAEERAAAARDRATAAQARANAEPPRVPQSGLIGAGSQHFAFEGSAQRSAVAFEELIGAQERLEARTRALMSAIDPAYAAQDRFNREMAEARDLVSQGALSLDQYVAKLRHEEAALEAVATAQRRGGVSAGAHAGAMQNLSYQAQDFLVQIQSGTPIITAVTQQGTQAAAALTGLSGAAGKFGAFMQSGWGLAITASVIGLGFLISKLTEEKETLESATAKLVKDAEATELNRRAKEALTRTVRGQIDAQRALNDELERSARTQRQQQQQTLFNAQRELSESRDSRGGLVENIRRAEAQVADYQRRLAAFANDPKSFGAVAAEAALTRSRENVAKLKADLVSLDTEIARGEQSVRRAQQPLLDTSVEASMDRKAAATLRYTQELGRLKAQQAIGAGQTGTWNEMQADGSFARRTLSGISNDQYREELRRITERRDADIKAEQDRQAEIRKTTQLRDREAASVANVSKLLRESLPGVRITSTTGGKHVAGSDHYAGRAIDFVPAGGMGSLTKDQVRDMVEGWGLSIRRNGQGVEQLFGPGDKGHSDHWHVAFEGAKIDLQNFAGAAKVAEERARELTDLTQRFDPAAAAAGRYAETLASIAKLNPENAEGMRAGAWVEYIKARAEAFSLPEVEGRRGEYEANDAAEKDADQKRRDANQRRDEFVRSTFADQADSLAMAERELQLVGANDNLRQAEITKLDLLLRLKREGVDATSADGEAILSNAERLAELTERARRYSAAWDEISQIGGSAIDRLFDPSSAETWGDRVMGVLGEIQQEFVRLALINPLKNALFGQANQTLGGIAGLFGGGGSYLAAGSADSWYNPGGSFVDPTQGIGAIAGGASSGQAYAVGTEWATGGQSLVGEHGPEVVEMPRGAKVYSAGETRRMMAANDRMPAINIPINIDATGADAAGLSRVEQAVMQLRQELPGQIVAVVNDGLERRLIG